MYIVLDLITDSFSPPLDSYEDAREHALSIGHLPESVDEYIFFNVVE